MNNPNNETINEFNGEINAKVEEILNKYKLKKEEIQKKLYESEARQKILEQNIEQQKEALKQAFGTDDINQIKEIKTQYEKTLQDLIQKIEATEVTPEI